MAFKFIAALCFVATVAAGTLDHLEYRQPEVHHQNIGHAHYEEEHHAPAHYEFSYSVHDEHTGDIKEQKEQRDGDKVEGYYTVVEPDGHKRTVHYTADKHSGFNAQVERTYVGGHEVQHQQQHKVAVAAPVVAHKIIAAAPIQYHSSGDYSNAGNDYESHSYSSHNEQSGLGSYSSNNYHH